MDPGYARVYRELHERHWWWRAREAKILDQLRRFEPPGGFGAILDVGCGDGLWFDALTELGQPEGLEPEAAIVSEESRRRFTFYLRPFDRAFDPGRRYGLILMLDVLEHLPDEAGALQHVFELLRPGGILVLTVPAFRLLWTAHDDLNRHRTRYTRVELLRALRTAGLQVRSVSYFFHWLFAIKLAVRVKERLLGREPRPPRLPPAVLNRVFYRLSRFEERMPRSLRPPFGSSLMAISQRAESA